ncbi:MAG: PilZ domain-containing protein [Deltaproteobacteria bacterium]|nr:PilZ domain-containing protein [Deltaproteobacteria bacterium]
MIAKKIKSMTRENERNGTSRDSQENGMGGAMEDSSGDQNLRSADRVPFRSMLKLQNGSESMVMGVDLSPGGMGIEIDRPLNVGDKVNLIFLNDTFKVDGSVKHCRESANDGLYRVGVQFNLEIKELIDVLVMLDREYNPL